MYKRILNNGVYTGNAPALNRKIRLSNLVSLLTTLILTAYLPLFLRIATPLDMTFTFAFHLSALVNFALLNRRKYLPAFIQSVSVGYVFFAWAGMAYGLHANLHLYLLIMCIIVAVLFDNPLTVKLIIAFTVCLFLAVVWYMKDREGTIVLPPDIAWIKAYFGYVNLVFLFIIVSLFVLFFKNDNIKHQHELTQKSKIIAEKNRDIIDSINYASRLQSAFLPAKNGLQHIFPGSFIYFNPKDIVSGDFYWYHQTEKHIYVAAGDCTGHGVPGALMSVLGMNLLLDIVEEKQISNPVDILDKLRAGVIRALHRNDTPGEYKDGMDIALARINRQTGECMYAGANNPVYHIANGLLNEHRATRQPIGYSANPQPFTSNTFTLAPGDWLILFSDGYADQFGGPANKKYTYKRFKELLVQQVNASHAEENLHREFMRWRAAVEQIDDVLVMGIKFA